MKRKNKSKWVWIGASILIALILVVGGIGLFISKVISLPQGDEAIKSMNSEEKAFLEDVINTIDENTTSDELISKLGEPSDVIPLGAATGMIKWSYPFVPSGQVRVYYYDGQVELVRWITFKFNYEVRFDSEN